MSHNVTLSGIKFKDIGLLKAAFDEIVAEGGAAAKYEFVNGRTTVRGWHGRTSPVDLAIKCLDQPYDIGFVKNADGEYTPFLEHGFCARGLATDHNAKTVDGASCMYGHESMALGRLQQRYGVLLTEQNARRTGAMVRRINAADGQIQLQVISR